MAPAPHNATPKAKAKAKADPLPAESTPAPAMTDDVQARLQALVAAANAGDQAAAKRALALVEQSPALLNALSTLQHTAEQSWLALLYGTSDQETLGRKVSERDLAQLRRDLLGAHAAPLERVLVDRVVVAWLQAHYADVTYARQLQGEMSLKMAEYLQRRCERAQRQLLRALTTLATVRQKLTPAQLNIALDGGQQVNIAGPSPSTADGQHPEAAA